MGARPEDEVAQEVPLVTEAEEIAEIDDTLETAGPGGHAEAVAVDEASTVGDVTDDELAQTVDDARWESPLGEVAVSEAGVVVTVLDEDEFRAGESFTIRVLVEDRSRKKEQPLMGVAVSVKILGTTFRPQIYSVKTERDGVAVVSTTMPRFTSGRAAVLIRAVAHGQTTELRRVIHPAQ